MHHLWVWILELTGSQSSSSKAYNFWSGFGGDVAILASILAAPIVFWRKHDCDVRRCPRLARHDFKNPETGVVNHLCRKHHPEESKKPVTAEQIRHQYHLYLGKKPGRG